MTEAITLEEAMALPRPKRGVKCRGWAIDGSAPHDTHNMERLPPLDPKRMGNYFGHEFYARWRDIPDGRACRTCSEVYDPTPMCEQIVDRNSIWKYDTLCDAPVKYREPGVIALRAALRLEEHAGATEEHGFCGKHAPSQMLIRRQTRMARHAEEQAARVAYRAPYVERDAARAALVDEARRWRDDEAATSSEGFCETCEHHECRLARAVERLERAEAALEARRRDI